MENNLLNKMDVLDKVFLVLGASSNRGTLLDFLLLLGAAAAGSEVGTTEHGAQDAHGDLEKKQRRLAAVHVFTGTIAVKG